VRDDAVAGASAGCPDHKIGYVAHGLRASEQHAQGIQYEDRLRRSFRRLGKRKWLTGLTALTPAFHWQAQLVREPVQIPTTLKGINSLTY